MFVSHDFEDVLARLGDAAAVICDNLVPAEQQALPSNPYREEYAWQHSYERHLLRRARQWLESQRHELIGSRGLLSEALSNAYAHGNQRDPLLVIRVELFVGREGYVIRVTHSGDGFDAANVLDRYRRRIHYYSVGGNGTRKLDESRTFRAFYDQTGHAIHLWYAPSWPAEDARHHTDEPPHSASEPKSDFSSHQS